MKLTLVNVIYIFTLVVMIAIQLQALQTNAEDQHDNTDLKKRAYHFFRLRRSAKCLSMPTHLKEMITENPYILCPEDREFLGL
ncbi:unnamed protein product [Heterobilharzia americana]|nr:unnamed protein product [Heterobilharzia americana]CAH8602382.1 unnamed protein product [Heterobilharzia americana]